MTDPGENAQIRAMVRSSRRTDLVALLGSGLVGALALAVSTYNVYLQRVQIRAQLWPHLEWSYSNVDGYAFKLQNSGVGPAQIKGMRVTVDHQPVASWNEVHELLATSAPAAFEGCGWTKSQVSRRVLAAGATEQPIELRVLDWANGQKAITEAFERVYVELCYCSTLDECWMLRGNFDSEPVSTCPLPRLTFRD